MDRANIRLLFGQIAFGRIIFQPINHGSPLYPWVYSSRPPDYFSLVYGPICFAQLPTVLTNFPMPPHSLKNSSSTIGTSRLSSLLWLSHADSLLLPQVHDSLWHLVFLSTVRSGAILDDFMGRGAIRPNSAVSQFSNSIITDLHLYTVLASLHPYCPELLCVSNSITLHTNLLPPYTIS